MSPAAVAGPPNGSVGSGGTASAPGYPAVPTAKPSENGKPTTRIFPHIEDLVSVQPEIDAHAPMRRLLQQADLNARQADTQLDFRRPDIALQEYIKASIIVVEIIPRHKDYPALQADRGELHRLYAGLKKRIISQHARFDDVKEAIKENNAKNGVLRHVERPMVTTSLLPPPQVPPPPPPHGQDPIGVPSLGVNGASVPPSHSRNLSDGSRKKPAIQPKPRSLQGNALHAGPSPPPTVDDDLITRFSRLRSQNSISPPKAAEPTPIQDPRIRTRSIVPPEPASNSSPRNSLTAVPEKRNPRQLGLVDFPSVPSGFGGPKTLQDVPQMPRAPDAIYSPAKTDGAEHLDQPQSSAPSPFNLSRRQSSITALSTSQNGAAAPNGPIPMDVTSITADELVQLLKMENYRILLVDVRSREEFDGGHIMWRSIICVEPIVLKDGVSAKDVEESLILSPESEQKLFDMRNQFDAIVYYDQDSKAAQPINVHAPYEPLDDFPLRNFQRALYVLEYEKTLKRRPLLLVGGLDAWINLVGPGSLQTSKTGISSTQRRRPSYLQDFYLRQKKYTSRGLSAEEEKAWADQLKEDEALSAKNKESIEGQYLKSTEEFLRRYPAPLPIKESMTEATELAQVEEVRPPAPPPHAPRSSAIPQIPVRPPPAVPRRSYSGVSAREESNVPTNFSTAPLSSDLPPVPPGVIRGNTGLSNQRNSCYMNSIIQCLSGTVPLRDHLMHNLFAKRGPPPRKEKEDSDPPQLLTKNLAQLFRHLWGGYTYITPRTLENYIRRIHSLSRVNEEDLFATGRQQDAVAYLLFLMDVLSDELNYRRDRPSLAPLTPAAEKKLMELPLFTASYTEWLRWSSVDDSLIMSLFRGLTATIRECQHCHRVAKNWDIWSVLQMRPSTSRNDAVQDLEDDFRVRFGGRPSESVEVKCDACKVTTSQPLAEKITRCPNILIIQIARFRHDTYSTGSEISKNNRKVHIPLHLDMAPYVASFAKEDMVEAHQLPPEFRPPFKYECYAVVQHSGGLNSGHYWTLRQGDNNSWWKFNDSSVTPADVRDIQSTSSYIVFYRRIYDLQAR